MTSIKVSSRAARSAPLTVSAIFAASLAACGGGGGGDGGVAPPAAPSAITLSGTVVIDQAISGSVVCVDLNSNGACDTGEPVATATGADGKYSITYQPSTTAAATAFNASAVLASVSTTSVDAVDPSSTATTSAFVMLAPAGRASQINPLTTLVQKAIAAGQTRDAAEAAVASQLGIAVSKIYNYQDDAASSAAVLPDTARTLAKVTAYALELGIALSVPTASSAAAPGVHLARLDYTDAQNYSYRVRSTEGVVGSDGYIQQFESRAGRTAGTALTNEQLFPSATLTSSGWVRCDGSVPRLLTRGEPVRAFLCNKSSAYVSFGTEQEDVSGKFMADVVAQMQTGNSKLNTEGVDYDRTLSLAAPSALGSNVFPAGSLLRTAISIQNGMLPPFINNTTTDRFGFPSLTQMVSARPVSGVNLATAAGTVGGVGPLDLTHVLRIAFVDSSTVQFYSCEATAPQYTNPQNCLAQSQSAFTIETVNGVPLMTFANSPGVTFQGGTRRGFTEYDGVVHSFRQPAAVTDEGQVVTYNQRLNGPAWTAMKSALNIVD